MTPKFQPEQETFKANVLIYIFISVALKEYEWTVFIYYLLFHCLALCFSDMKKEPLDE